MSHVDAAKVIDRLSAKIGSLVTQNAGLEVALEQAEEEIARLTELLERFMDEKRAEDQPLP